MEFLSTVHGLLKKIDTDGKKKNQQNAGYAVNDRNHPADGQMDGEQV